MSNFIARNLSLGQVNALVKRLGGEAVVLGILNGTMKFTVEATDDGQLFDEAAFFETRSGLWVDSDLERYVELDHRSTLGATMLKHRQLERNTSEADIFGQSGSELYRETLDNACDLGQIAELITAQEGGQPGVLLNNGYANLFPVRGKVGSLRVVSVRWNADHRTWHVYCHPFKADLVWNAGDQVFSN